MTYVHHSETASRSSILSIHHSYQSVYEQTYVKYSSSPADKLRKSLLKFLYNPDQLPNEHPSSRTNSDQKHTPHQRIPPYRTTENMPRGNAPQVKVIYKGGSDSFVVFVDNEQTVKDWRKDRSIPLAQVMAGFKIFQTHKYVINTASFTLAGLPSSPLMKGGGMPAEDCSALFSRAHQQARPCLPTQKSSKSITLELAKRCC